MNKGTRRVGGVRGRSASADAILEKERRQHHEKSFFMIFMVLKYVVIN